MKDKSLSIRGAMTTLCLSILLAALGTSIANVALPTLAHAFHASFQSVQWVVLAYLLAITSLIVSAGRLGDTIGHRRMILSGLVLFMTGSLLSGFAPTLWLLIISRALQGLGAAIMMALSMALVSEAVPRQKIGSAMGLLGTMSAVGTALGPTLGGFLISAFNWRAIFLINIPLGLTALYLALRYLPADQKLQNTQRPKFDNVGTSLLAVSLVIYAMAMTLGHGHYGVINLLLLLGAFAGAGLFIFAESKAKSPLIKLSMFRNRVLSIGISVNVLVISVMMATLVVGPFYLSRALGLDVAKVGLVVSIGPIVAALSGIPAGRLVDRFGASGIASIGLIGLATGSLLLSLTSITLGVIGYVLPIAIITSSFALFQAANNTAVMTNIDQSQRGLISGILNLSRNLGLITGTSVMGAIFAFASNTSDLTSAHPGEVAKGMHITFLIAAILMLLGLLLMTNLNLSKRRKKILSRYETEDTTLIERARYLLIHWRCLLGYC